jgi:polyisoprenoid-binding protein YceI
MMLRRALTVAWALAALAAPAMAGTTWDIDPAHTSVQFAVRHLMISTVRGEFAKVSGTVVSDDKDLTKTTIQATVDASSVDTREPKRDEHLKSPDFFDVAQFPTITFASKKIAPAGKGKWKVTGDLTLHGVTRPVVLAVEATGVPIKDMMGKARAGAHATTRINRKDFGIVWNKTLDGGGLAVGDDVDITIDVEAVQQAAAGG